MIVQIWTLKRGPLNPHEPLPEEESRRIERLWYLQDHPIETHRLSSWRGATLAKELITMIDR